MASSKPPILQLALLALLLIVLPAGSFIYLKKGYDYRLESLDELNNFGPISKAVNYTQTVSGKSVDLVYVSPRSSTDSVAIAIGLLFDAFKKQDSVRFIGIGKRDQPLLISNSQTLEVGTSMEVDLSEFDKISSQDVHCANFPIYQRALIVDTLGIVKRCYNLHDGKEVNRIVEQLNILIPRPVEKDIFRSAKREY